MQGSFPLHTLNQPQIPPAPPTHGLFLEAPLVDWDHVTAVPDTMHGGAHNVIPPFIVYSPLPHFKLDKFTFFIVPRGTNNPTEPIRKVEKVRWLVPYTAKVVNERPYGVSYAHTLHANAS